MSRLKRAEAVLQAAEQWKERCLLGGGSMFWEDKKLWTAENFEELLDCLRNHSQSFTGEDLMQLLKGASADVKQLATEVRWLDYLSEPGTSVASKTSALRAMWKWLGEPYPKDHPLLADAMLVGVVKTNMSSHRCYEYRCLSERMIDWASLPADRQNGLMEDHWEFGRWVHSKEDPRPRVFPHVLCYLLFPDVFEPIGHTHAKRKVLRYFRPNISPAQPPDVDQHLLDIRTRLAEERARLTDDNRSTELDLQEWADDHKAWHRERFDDTRVWLMAAGRDGDLWQIFIDDGIASLGFADIGDLNQYESGEEIMEALSDKKKDKAQPTVTAGMLRNFYGKRVGGTMQIGDTIVVDRKSVV